MGAIARRNALRRSAVRRGAVGIAAAITLSLFAVTAKNGLPDYLPGVDRFTTKVAFSDVGALRAGDDVRIADVRAGFVSEIELVDGVPVATLELNDRRPVYRDARAEISARSGLGQKYVNLRPGTEEAGELRPSDVLPADRTTSAVELDDVLDALDEKTRTEAASTLREAGGGLSGRGRDVADFGDAADELLTDLGTVSEALAADDGQDLAQMLRTADLLSQSLDGQEKQVAATVRNLGDTLTALDIDDGDPLTRTLTEGPETLRALRPALDALEAPLSDARVAVTRLEPGAESLAAAMPDLRGFLRESPTTLDKVPGLADVAEPAVEDLTPTVLAAAPVVTQLATTFARASTPLAALAPYSEEVLLFFQNASSALSQGDGAGRWLRFYPVLTPEAVLGALPFRDPTTSRQAYPAPGEARTHREGSVFGEGFR